MSRFIDLESFIPQLSPRFVRTTHLRPLTDIFQRIASGERVRAVISVPPRHSKTETLLHGIAWLLVQNPTLQIAYASYAARIAEKKSRRARDLAHRAGVPLALDAKSRADWRTGHEEGGCWATSVDGQITGEGFHVALLDDLIKGRAEAESASSGCHRAMLRTTEPPGSMRVSTSLMSQALARSRVAPLHELRELREVLGGTDGYEWKSLYMGNPRGRGARVFGDVNYFEAPPDLTDARIGIGLDFAYSSRTSADWSVAVVVANVGDAYYVLDVVRVREEPRAFRERVKLLVATYPDARVCAYAAATEMGGIEFIRDGGVRIDGRQATIDKFSRAIPVAAAWNMGKVLLPRKAHWLNAFVSEVCGFTGVKDRHDDQVDSLAAAFDVARRPAPVRAMILNPAGDEHGYGLQFYTGADGVRRVR